MNREHKLFKDSCWFVGAFPFRSGILPRTLRVVEGRMRASADHKIGARGSVRMDEYSCFMLSAFDELTRRRKIDCCSLYSRSRQSEYLDARCFLHLLRAFFRRFCCASTSGDIQKYLL